MAFPPANTTILTPALEGFNLEETWIRQLASPVNPIIESSNRDSSNSLAAEPFIVPGVDSRFVTFRKFNLAAYAHSQSTTQFALSTEDPILPRTAASSAFNDDLVVAFPTTLSADPVVDSGPALPDTMVHLSLLNKAKVAILRKDRGWIGVIQVYRSKKDKNVFILARSDNLEDWNSMSNFAQVKARGLVDPDTSVTTPPGKGGIVSVPVLYLIIIVIATMIATWISKMALANYGELAFSTLMITASQLEMALANVGDCAVTSLMITASQLRLFAAEIFEALSDSTYQLMTASQRVGDIAVRCLVERVAKPAHAWYGQFAHFLHHYIQATLRCVITYLEHYRD